MHTPPCTTVAGRLAADRRRAAAAGLVDDAHDRARNELERALRLAGLSTQPHFHRELAAERSLWVDCRLASAHDDHRLVYAVLDAQGWRPDRERLSRHGQRYDVLRLRHAGTDATVVVIVKVPFGEVVPLEAA